MREAVKIFCPRCSAELNVRLNGKGGGTMPEHNTKAATRTFTKIPGSDINHFFDYHGVCGMSGAKFTLGVRS
jgi:hypothetical protein